MSIIIPGILNDGQVTTANINDNAVTQAKLAHDIDVSHLINDAGYITNVSSFDTDDVSEGSTNLYHTDARAVSAVEGETTLNLQEGLTIDTDIEIGDVLLRDIFAATGMKISNPATKNAWAGVVLEEYGGDYSSGQVPYNFHNPSISGEVHGGTPASPTAVSAFTRTASLIGNARYGTGSGESDTVGNITISTNENQTATNRGGKIGFSVNPTGGGTDTKEVMILTADTNANFMFDPNGDFNSTTISTNSTNGFQWQNSNTFQNDVQMDSSLNVSGNITLATGDVTVSTGTMQGATVNAYTLNAGNITISGDIISTSGSEVEFDSDFNVTGTTYFGTGSGTGISSTGEIGIFGSATSVPFSETIKLDRKTADPTGEAGMMYFNTTTNKFRGYNGTAWVDLG